MAANSDPYGRAVYTYAERWPRMMQARMKSCGQGVDIVASGAAHDANVEGITGFMYGCAVSILAECWIHGDELRRWHNLDVQLGDEGKRANEKGTVLNPAVVTVGSKGD